MQGVGSTTAKPQLTAVPTRTLASAAERFNNARDAFGMHLKRLTIIADRLDPRPQDAAENGARPRCTGKASVG